jgi:hypothetical protein
MGARDAVNLLIAVNGSRLAKDVHNRLPVFRSLRLDWTDADWAIRNLGLRELVASDEPFGDHLANLLELARPDKHGSSALSRLLEKSYRKSDAGYAAKRNLEFPSPRLEIEFGGPAPAAAIRLMAPSVGYKDRWNPRVDIDELAGAIYLHESLPKKMNPSADRFERVVISDRTLTETARLLWS